MDAHPAGSSKIRLMHRVRGPDPPTRGMNRSSRAGGSEAERGGFEPPNETSPLLVFETSPFSHSGTSPGWGAAIVEGPGGPVNTAHPAPGAYQRGAPGTRGSSSQTHTRSSAVQLRKNAAA